MCAADLAPINNINDMSKYADDVILIIPVSSLASCSAEMQHIDQWSNKMNLELNRVTSAKIVFQAHGVTHSDLAPESQGIE